MTRQLPHYLTTREVAELIRLKERKVYDLVASREIPFVRVTGKLLFPLALIEAWLVRHAEFGRGLADAAARPPICAGSHDPLLDWSLREAHTGIAVAFGGSLDGLQRLARGQAVMAGVHLPEQGQDAWNREHVRHMLVGQPVVLIEWARRTQGLIVAANNPLGLQSVKDLRGCRVMGRQREAGAFVLLQTLLHDADLPLRDLKLVEPPALTEADVAAAVDEGRADAGLGIASVAHHYRLGFVPLVEERYDLVLWRAAYFEEPFQKLLAFTRTKHFTERATGLRGYDVSGLGRVHFNAC
jgi:putative molybdopterin biosynthesis protein